MRGGALRSTRRWVLIRSAAVALAAGSAHAAAPLLLAHDPKTATALERFLDGLHSFRAEFSQEVTGAHGRIVSRSRGELVVVRPGKFRWSIHPSGQGRGGQLLVADGRNLWYYDRDLQQVTVRREQTALSSMPALLLSGDPDALAGFEVSPAGRKRGIDWVRVVPKAADADFKQALLGFSGRKLKRMILDDKLGQTTTLIFAHVERNIPVAAPEMRFTPPAGVDVIGKPQK